MNSDKYCLLLCNSFLYFLSIIFYPLKLICSILTNFFQRPFSFLFFINHFILMTPSILLLVVFINNNDNIKKKHISKYYYLQLISLGINYYLNFIIYSLYQEHNLNIGNMNKLTVKKLSKFIKKYISNHKIIFFILFTYLFNIIMSIITLKNNWNLIANIEKDFLIISSIINISFSGGYIFLYIYLIFILYCSIKNCCLIDLFCEKNVNHYINFENLNIYLKLSLSFFQFIGFFDYEKLLIEDLSSSTSTLNDNNNMKIRLRKEKV